MKSKVKIIFDFKLNEKENKIKTAMAYDCHSIPADFAKRQERGLETVWFVVRKHGYPVETF